LISRRNRELQTRSRVWRNRVRGQLDTRFMFRFPPISARSARNVVRVQHTTRWIHSCYYWPPLSCSEQNCGVLPNVKNKKPSIHEKLHRLPISRSRVPCVSWIDPEACGRSRTLTLERGCRVRSPRFACLKLFDDFFGISMSNGNKKTFYAIIHTWTHETDSGKENALMQCCVRYALLKIIVKIDRLCRDKFNVVVKIRKFGTLHEFACHPCAGAMLIFSVSFQF